MLDTASLEATRMPRREGIPGYPLHVERTIAFATDVPISEILVRSIPHVESHYCKHGEQAGQVSRHDGPAPIPGENAARRGRPNW
jgi:hypothetical protein